ncbi:hypothetical protein BpHYR1_010456 [Brachionus plicatilis]|uniref:Uncharacterized protein n=1 Tax=Brachionus plicatilis TaxID=10195 RepID=A0A3M7SLA1_BRAPC|nr:hypothetical protein BpHYR1_010456 [Brachionus plicatilis]
MIITEDPYLVCDLMILKIIFIVGRGTDKKENYLKVGRAHSGCYLPFEIFYHMPKCLIHRTKAQLIKRLNDYITLNGINVGQVENEEQVEKRSEEEEEFTDVQINTNKYK